MSSNSSDDEESAEDSSEEELDLSQASNLLLEAACRNDVAGVRRALRNGANANGVYDGRMILTYPCNQGHDETVRILLEAGADPSKIEDDWSPICDAIDQGHLSTVEILLNHDNGLLEIEGSFGKTPLLRALCKEQFGIVRFLLDRGANALATDVDGRTTLMLACDNGADLEIVRRLLAAGVSVEARDKDQHTALHHAAPWGNVETIRELIVEHNANMFAVDKYGKRPLIQ